MVIKNGAGEITLTESRASVFRGLVEHLSSLSFCFVLMAALALWLGMGILLTRHPVADSIIKGMNDELILSWLGNSAASHPLISGWLIVLMGLSGLLFINLACCCFMQPALKIRLNSGARPLLLFTLHVLIGLVMIGHGAHMAIGFKSSNMELLPGQSNGLPDGTTIELKSASCSFASVLQHKDRQQRRQLLTRDRVRLKDNYIDFSVSREGATIQGGRACLLKPYRRGAFRVTLNRFFLIPEKSLPDTGVPAVGAVITVVENPLHELFFGVYAFMILTFLAYLIVSVVTTRK